MHTQSHWYLCVMCVSGQGPPHGLNWNDQHRKVIHSTGKGKGEGGCMDLVQSCGSSFDYPKRIQMTLSSTTQKIVLFFFPLIR